MFLRWFLKCSCRYDACKNRSYGENKGKQGRKAKTEQLAPPHFGNCWEHFDHFPKFISCVLYLISKLGKSGAHSFKRCSIWSWKEEVMAIWRQLCKAERECCKPHPILLLLDTFLEHFLELKLCIPYLFLKLRKSGVQCFKRCAIWIWNEEVMAIWKNPILHLGGWIVPCAKFSHNTRTTPPLCEFLSFFIPSQSQAFEPCPQLLKVGPTHHFCKYLV